jgi:hypothetical protein
MDVSLSALLNFYVFSVGRRLFAVGQVKKIALGKKLKAIANHADVCLAHDRETRALEASYAGQPEASAYSPEARQLDTYVDIALGALRDAIDSHIKVSLPGDPLADLAAKFLTALFPLGVAAVTTLNFVEEVEEVDRIAGVLKDKPYAEVIAGFGLGRYVDRITGLSGQYRAAVEAGAPAKVSFNRVKEANAKGQSLMMELVAMILGEYPLDSDEGKAVRLELLGPILTQDEAIRQSRRMKKPVEDVNPDTGEVEPAPGEAGNGGGGSGEKPE